MKTWLKMKYYPKIGLVALAYVAFVALGLPDGLLGVAWPSIRVSFGLPLDAVGMLITAAMAGYMISSFSSGPMIARLGVGRLLALSCALTGAGLIGYTLVPWWWMMVLLGIVAGLGAGAIDAGLNTYVAAHFSEGLMQWLHASWGIGVTFGPIIMTIGLATLNTWHAGYRGVGIFQLALAACFMLTMAMWGKAGAAQESDSPQRLTDYQTPMSETLRQPQVWLSILLFFLYVGGESSLGTWVYSLLVESRGVEPALAGLFAGSYWATFTVGRVAAGLLARRAGATRLVAGGLAGAVLGASLLIWNPSQSVNLLAVALIGFAIAPIFPALTSGTSQRVGARFAANTIGMQMAATGLGIAVIPSLMGVLANQMSLEVVPLCLLAVYLALSGVFFLALRSAQRPAAKSKAA